MAPETPKGAGDLARVRRRKIERYHRVGRLARQGMAFPREPIEASSEAAQHLVKKFPVTCLEFWAEWCAPCLKMKPLVNELALQFWGDIAFVRVSLDRSPEARDRWNVTVLPTIIITHGGRESARRHGALTRRRLEAFLEPFAGTAGQRPRAAGSSGPPGRRGGA